MILLEIIGWILAGNVAALLVAYQIWRAGDLHDIRVGNVILFVVVAMGGWFSLILALFVTIFFGAMDFMVGVTRQRKDLNNG
jgi:hypothetical protein